MKSILVFFSDCPDFYQLCGTYRKINYRFIRITKIVTRMKEESSYVILDVHTSEEFDENISQMLSTFLMNPQAHRNFPKFQIRISSKQVSRKLAEWGYTNIIDYEASMIGMEKQFPNSDKRFLMAQDPSELFFAQYFLENVQGIFIHCAIVSSDSTLIIFFTFIVYFILTSYRIILHINGKYGIIERKYVKPEKYT